MAKSIAMSTITNCTRRVDPHCKEKYINKTDLCIMLQEFIQTNYKINISDKFRARVERHYGITKTLFDHHKIEAKLDNPFIQYSRFVLGNGTENEKTSLAIGITSKILIKDGKLRFG